MKAAHKKGNAGGLGATVGPIAERQRSGYYYTGYSPKVDRVMYSKICHFMCRYEHLFALKSRFFKGKWVR
jgi:hypothetical protein